MGDKSQIEWTDATWNPTSGCSKVSQGCKHCYAERLFPRVYGSKWKAYPGPVVSERGRAFTDVRTHPDRLDQPLRWRKPRRVFVNSMSDLFHEDVPTQFIDRVFAVMALAHRHTFQILTKRTQRMRAYFDSDPLAHLKYWTKYGDAYFDIDQWPLPNVWLCVSVEDQDTADERIPQLLQTPAAVRGVSYEPALGPILLTRINVAGKGWQDVLNGWRDCWDYPGRENLINWVIAGGESGPNARPAHPDWFRSVRDQCQAAGVAFFFKQWGEWAPYDRGRTPLANPGTLDHPMERFGKKAAGRLLDGRTWDEFPK